MKWAVKIEHTIAVGEPRAREPVKVPDRKKGWSSPLGSTRSRTQSSRLDDLPFHGKAPIFAEPAQALDDLVVPDLLCRAAIFANHELTLMGMVYIAADDIGARRLYLVDQLVCEQEFECAVDSRRPEPAAPALQLCEQRNKLLSAVPTTGSARAPSGEPG